MALLHSRLESDKEEEKRLRASVHATSSESVESILLSRARDAVGSVLLCCTTLSRICVPHIMILLNMRTMTSLGFGFRNSCPEVRNPSRCFEFRVEGSEILCGCHTSKLESDAEPLSISGFEHSVKQLSVYILSGGEEAYLTQNVFEVVLSKLISTQSCQLIR